MQSSYSSPVVWVGALLCWWWCTLGPPLPSLQVDLVEIKAAFLERYHKTLYKMIEGDTSGDYRKLLLGIVGRN